MLDGRRGGDSARYNAAYENTIRAVNGIRTRGVPWNASMSAAADSSSDPEESVGTNIALICAPNWESKRISTPVRRTPRT